MSNYMLLVEKARFVVIRNAEGKEITFPSFDEFYHYCPISEFGVDLTDKEYVDYEPERGLFIDAHLSGLLQDFVVSSRVTTSGGKSQRILRTVSVDTFPATYPKNIVVVPDSEARYALTDKDVSTWDIVIENDSGTPYWVENPTALDSDIGYQYYSSAHLLPAGSVAVYDNLINSVDLIISRKMDSFYKMSLEEAIALKSEMLRHEVDYTIQSKWSLQEQISYALGIKSKTEGEEAATFSKMVTDITAAEVEYKTKVTEVRQAKSKDVLNDPKYKLVQSIKVPKP